MNLKKCLLLSLSVLSIGCAAAQDSTLLKSLNESLELTPKGHVSGTFKALYIVNTQTVEQPGAGALNFEIQHRFGKLNSGSYNFFGLDNATLRLGLDYGISSRLSIGVGRSSYLKTFDGYVKYKLLLQSDGSNRMPVTVDIVGIASNYTQHSLGDSLLNAKYRTTYGVQLLIARKISSILSLQLSPIWLHYNLVPATADKNDVFALGVGGRLKITRRMSINAEYNYLPSNQVVSATTNNSFSLGWDIETGGHVFQLVFSNSQSIVPTQFVAQSVKDVPQSTGNWAKGDVYFGFNISRAFNLKKKQSLVNH